MKNILKSVAAVALVVLMAACGEKTPTADQVATSINTNKELTEADYACMVDYCGDYAKDAQHYFDIINSQPNDSTADAIKAADGLASLYEKYSYIDLFLTKLESTDISVMGEKNAKKINEYAALEAFPLPGGEEANMLSPDVEGVIEQMPAESTAVIANGAGEAVK